jgi:hypothetical protein
MRKTLFAIRYSLFARSSRASRRGQSLIEAIVAITVLTTGFLGISSLLAKSYTLNHIVSDQVTANYLASEGIEIAKNLIDHDTFKFLSGDQSSPWGTCFSFPHNDVELDYTTTDCSSLSGFSLSDYLKLDPVTHLYGYNPPPGDNPVATSFTREISVRTSGNEITVNSIVRWDTGSVIGQSLNLEDRFYNWRQ